MKLHELYSEALCGIAKKAAAAKTIKITVDDNPLRPVMESIGDQSESRQEFLASFSIEAI